LASDEVILEDNFESGSLSGWSTVTQNSGKNTFTVTNYGGSNVLNIKGSGGSCLKGNVTSTNYTIDADVYIYDGSYNPYAVGILFGASTLSSSMSGMDGYIFQARPGLFQIEKWTKGVGWEYLGHSGNGLTTGTWNHLKVEVNGPNVKCYANNRLIFDKNFPKTTGYVGFRTWIAGAYFDNLVVTGDKNCNLKIAVNKQTITPYSGGNINITGNISDSSGKPITWKISLPNGKEVSGSGNSPSAAWDGKDASGKLVEPGSYSATITADNGDGCSDTANVPITVSSISDGNSCSLQVQVGSSANVANGNLSHSQDLFSSRGSSLPLDMTLYYNSLDPLNGSLGLGWSHDYDVSLTENSDGSVLLKEGNWQRRLYTLSGGTYSAQPQDYSTLVKKPDNTFVLTHKGGLKYIFNSDGTIAAMVDRNNNTVAFSYSGGKLGTVTDPAGRSAILSYDSDGHLTAVTDPAGRNYTLGYSGGTLTNVTYPDGGTWLYTYDDKAFMLSKVDPLGTVTTYAYDDNHRILSATDAEGKTRTISYPMGPDTVKNTAFTEKDGGVWQYTYDTDKGTLNRKTDPQGGATSYTYDANGNRLSTTEPDGATTTFSYDSQSNMISSTNALGQTTGSTYNSFGQVTSVSDPQGSTTSYVYDANGNLKETTDASGATTRYEYGGKGNMTKLINPLGQATTFSYDSSGNMTSVTDPTGARTTFTYDASGNMITLTSATGAVTRFEYNANNQPVKTIDPNGNATNYAYDLAGNKISETDANGNTTTFEYNFLRQLVKTKDALGNVTAYSYAATGCSSCGGGTDKLTALTDANGHFTTYQYDSLGRLLKETDPLDSVTSYRYDAKGNLIGKTDANGASIDYRYDELGRLLIKSYPDGTQETFSYDAKGNIARAANKNIAYTYTYDANNRMVSVSDSNNRTLRYDYDLSGNKTALTMPDGQSVAYHYDAANRLAGIVGLDGTFGFNYDTLGRRTKLAYPHGAVASYSYDIASRLTKLEHKTAKGHLIDSFSYSHDKVGNRRTKTEPQGTTAYNYDTIYRLLGASPQKRGRQSDRESYGYDPVGNRLIGPDARQTYQYNAGNQLVEESAEQCRAPKGGMRNSYDKNGNLVMKEERNGSGHSQTTTHYSYDYENRLIKVEIEKGHKTQVVTFSYDPFGRRLSKTVEREDLNENRKGHGHEGCDDERQAPRTTHYLYDNEDIVMEYDGYGETLARYLHGPGIDEPLATVRKGKVYYYHADGLGSITALTGKHGNVVRKYDYDSFGNMAQEQRDFGQPYAYTGREWDKETGLYYYRARYYDPMDGRFIQKDPIGFDGGDVNVYAYVGNNVINKTDPTGLSVYYCKASDGWKHAWVCVNNSCAGLMPKGTPSFISGPGEIVKEPFTKDCTAKDVSNTPCCDQSKYESCVKREAIDKIGTSHSYGFSGLWSGNCNAWAQEVIVKCQREACKK
jgi:RHS repeat-associated protein